MLCPLDYNTRRAASANLEVSARRNPQKRERYGLRLADAVSPEGLLLCFAAASSPPAATDCCNYPQAKHSHEKAVEPREEQFIRFKTYGDASKRPLVIVPGLDGVTAFFSDIVPELTLNVRKSVVEKLTEGEDRSAKGG